MKNASFTSFQCLKISVILKNTEKMKKKISVFQVNFTEENFQFQCYIFSVSVRNFSEF